MPWGYISRSDFLPARFIEYYEIEKGFTSNLHPAPANQVLFMLKGILVIEASSGEKREFKPGSAVWVTDTHYKTEGHKTWVKGDSDVYAVYALVVIIDEKKVKPQYQ